MSVVNAYSITVSGTVSINVNTLLQSRKLSLPLGAIVLLSVSTLAISQSSQFSRQHSQFLCFNKTELNLRIYKISEDRYNVVKLYLHMLTA